MYNVINMLNKTKLLSFFVFSSYNEIINSINYTNNEMFNYKVAPNSKTFFDNLKFKCTGNCWLAYYCILYVEKERSTNNMNYQNVFT